jgi:hypothetical protein
MSPVEDAAMTIQFSCTGCGKTLQAPDELLGKRAKCKSCGTAVLISGSEPVEAEPVVVEPVRPVRRSEQIIEPEEVVRHPDSRADDADDEPRPRRRTRSREDDDIVDLEESRSSDRPRRRRRRRQSSGGSGAKFAVILAVVGLLLLIVLGGGGFAAWYFMRDTGPLAAEKKYLPDSISSISIYQLDKIKSSPAYADILKCSNQQQRFAFVKTSGGKELDVVRAVVAAAPYPITILTMRNPVTIKDVVDATDQPTESKESGKTIYSVGERGYFIDGKLVVMSTPGWLRHLLNLPHDLVLSDTMKTAFEKADFNKPVVHLRSFDDENRGQANVQGNFSLLGPPPQSMVMESDYQSPASIQMKFICKDANAANAMGQLFRGTTQAVQAFGPLKDSTVEVNDTTVSLRATIKASDLCNMPF